MIAMSERLYVDKKSVKKMNDSGMKKDSDGSAVISKYPCIEVEAWEVYVHFHSVRYHVFEQPNLADSLPSHYCFGWWCSGKQCGWAGCYLAA
jgi:hypothetical protein